MPALEKLHKGLSRKAARWDEIVKTGRTHLQDATPMRVGQEFSGFAAQVAEVKVVADALATGDPSCLAGTGAVVAGVKYMFVRGDADSVYVKKGAEGVYFFMCNTCVVVAYHNDKVQAGACNATAGKLVDFLKENSI